MRRGRGQDVINTIKISDVAEAPKVNEVVELVEVCSKASKFTMY